MQNGDPIQYQFITKPVPGSISPCTIKTLVMAGAEFVRRLSPETNLTPIEQERMEMILHPTAQDGEFEVILCRASMPKYIQNRFTLFQNCRITPESVRISAEGLFWFLQWDPKRTIFSAEFEAVFESEEKNMNRYLGSHCMFLP